MVLMMFNATFQQYFSYIVVVMFIKDFFRQKIKCFASPQILFEEIFYVIKGNNSFKNNHIKLL